MKKTIAIVGLFLLTTSMQAQEKSVENTKIPAWLNNIKLSGYGIVQYQGNTQEGAKSNSFNLRIARVSLDGRIANDFYWKAQIQFNGNTATLGSSPRVVDMFAEWQKYNFFMVKAGQFKRPFTFENPMHPIDQGFLGYSQNVNALAGFSDRAGTQASNGRDIGVQIQGDFLKNNNGRHLVHYQVGVFNGQGINTGDVDQQKDLIGGIWVMPVRGMRIGAFGWTGSYARKGTWTETDDTGKTSSKAALARCNNAAMHFLPNTNSTTGPFAPNTFIQQEKLSRHAIRSQATQAIAISTKPSAAKQTAYTP